MKNIKTVMLDVDGVLADFHAGVHRAFGVPDFDSSKLVQLPWDFWDVWDEPAGLTWNDIDDECDAAFWEGLPWVHDGRDILKAVLSRFDYSQICLLTVPMANPESTTGKMQWIKREIPKLYKRTIVVSSGVSKGLMASPTTLLIDDRDKNVDEFISCGGHAIQPPRPWNRHWPLSDLSLETIELQFRNISNVKRSAKEVHKTL